MNRIIFNPPIMSWDRPIEEILLDYCNSMARQWRMQESSNVHRGIREQAGAAAMAYETVAKKIKKETSLKQITANQNSQPTTKLEYEFERV